MGPAEWPCSWKCSHVQYGIALHSSQQNQLNHERIYQKIHVLYKGGCLSMMLKEIPDTPWSKKTPIPLPMNTKTNISVLRALQNNIGIDTLLVAWHEQVSQGDTLAARALCLDVTLEVSLGTVLTNDHSPWSTMPSGSGDDLVVKSTKSNHKLKPPSESHRLFSWLPVLKFQGFHQNMNYTVS